jgi:hypothetical protein
MTKMMICLSILMIAGFAMLKLIDIQVNGHESLANVAVRDKRVREQELNYYAFKHSFESTILSLRRNEMTLADALERVNDLAKRYNCDYVRHLTLVETGITQDERVARNLVGHVAALEEADPSVESHLPQLQVELAEQLKMSASQR